MMTDDMLAKLSAYLDGELNETDRLQMEKDLESDGELQAMFEVLTSADNSLRPAYAETLNASIPDRLTDILAEPERSTRPDWTKMIRGFLRPEALAGATAALVIGLVAGTALQPGTSQSSD